MDPSSWRGAYNGDVVFDRVGDNTPSSVPAAKPGGHIEQNALTDGFVMKLDENGFVLWFRRFTGSGNIVVTDVDLLPSGAYVVAGHFKGEAMLPEGAAPSVATSTSSDGFVSWLNGATGAGLETHVLVGTGDDRVMGVSAAADSGIVVVGDYSDQLTIPDGTGGNRVLPRIDPAAPAGNRDVFHVQFDSNRNLENTPGRTGGSLDDTVAAVTTVGEDGWAMAGTFELGAQLGRDSGQATIDLVGHSDGEPDIFVSCHGLDGSFRDGRSLGGEDLDIPHDIIAHPDGRLVVTGRYRGTMEDPGGANKPSLGGSTHVVKELRTNGFDDVFAVGIEADMSVEFTIGAGGPLDDSAFGVGIGADGAFVATGQFRQQITFDEDVEGDTTLQANPDGEADAFISRFNGDGSSTGFYEIHGYTGSEHLQELGGSVALLGDLDGDGRSEFAIGEGDTHDSGRGRVHLYSGATGLETNSISGGAMGSAGSLRSAGDVNGDGILDVIIGDPTDDTNGTDAGRIWVYSGTGGLLFEDFGNNPGDRLGHAVGGGGDINGDGFDDPIAGAPTDITDDQTLGYFKLYDGAAANGSTLLIDDQRDPGLLFDIGDGTSGFGSAVADHGHHIRDARADVVVGAPYLDWPPLGPDPARPDAGGIYTWSAPPSTPLGANNQSLATNHRFGISLDSIGDLNGDGAEETLVGADGAVVGGFESGAALVLNGVATPAVLFTFEGAAGSGTGRTVAAAGDVNGDGFPDFLVGSPNESELNPQGGAARLFSGKDFSVLFEWHGPRTNMNVGIAMDGGHDVDGDGRADIIIGGPGLRELGGYEPPCRPRPRIRHAVIAGHGAR